MTRAARVCTVLLAPMLATAGCAVSAVPSSGPVAVYPTPDLGMDALLTGTLRLSGGCVVVDGGAGEAAVPVFPSGDIAWDEDSRRLTWRGESYLDGDPISLGGGYGLPDGGYVPEACGNRETFLVSPR
ncbi:hypothetical protein [Microbacterium sp.]|uniref:hypothetical protein n=1 Tax=Microbacterium sp. TaxID=51671 RepID=UPI003A852957